MENDIVKFLDGSLFNEIYPLPYTEKYSKMLKKRISKNAELYDKLCDVDKALADEYMELSDRLRELFAYEQQESFKNGFCMGVKLIAEVYSHGDDKD